MQSIDQKRRSRPVAALPGQIYLLVITFCVLALAGSGAALSQTRLPPVTPAPTLPQPIYWKQDLFLVPYQWSSPGESGAATAVWLYVSKDHGATWQKLSEARPQVTSFNYRAESDGEYWFAVRTIDVQGRSWPAGPFAPELRVIVDTAMPQITELTATAMDNGMIEIAWSALDTNLDPGSLKVEAQMDAAGTWHPAVLQFSNLPAFENGIQSVSQVTSVTRVAHWQPPAGIRPIAIRATISDLAGNPASYQAQVNAAPPGRVAANAAMPPTTTSPGAVPDVGAGSAPPAGWVSSSAAAATPVRESATPQAWPAVSSTRSPFRLFSSGAVLPDDSVTAYGNPPTIDRADLIAGDQSGEEHRVAARYAGPVGREQSGSAGKTAPVGWPTPRNSGRHEAHRFDMRPKLVGSRTFALEYDLDAAGAGVTKVELWGTRDGGRTWYSYGRDDDHRSPFAVTVDDEGLYGFCIVVEAAGTVCQPPAAGDEPELWVCVDLHRPVAELTSIQRGEGNLADHLILRWQATDDNLEPRPISLFYSSRSGGPWSAIATHLKDEGEYAWRVERHVPTRVYLRLEARDTAGNLAAFQTREPIEFSPRQPAAKLRDVETWGPMAVEAEAAYR